MAAEHAAGAGGDQAVVVQYHVLLDISHDRREHVLRRADTAATGTTGPS